MGISARHIFWARFPVFLGIALAGSQMAAAGELGKKLFDDKCAICHGRNGKGDGPAAVSFHPKPADFTDPSFWKKLGEQKIEEIIKEGHGMMPAFDLNREQMGVILDYMKRTFKK